MSKRRSQRDRVERKSKFQLRTLSVSEENHPRLKAAMHEAALTAVSDFPKTLELVKDQLRHHDPIGIMACVAGYGLITTVDSRDGAQQKPFKNILQHHAELLQAIALTIAPGEWGGIPVNSYVNEIIFDSLPKLVDTFFFQRTLATEEVSDEEELTVLSLQERVRMNTMGVRNWGYLSAVVRISKELYSRVDSAFTFHHGFSCTDLIEVMHCAVKEFERRQDEHWNRFRKVMRGKNPRQVFRLYFKNIPGLVGSAEEMLAALPGIDLNGAKATAMAHYDLRLSDLGTFAPDEIAGLSGRSSQIVEKVFRAVSLKPGALAEAKMEHLFLGNPIWEAPGIDLDSSFFLPIPQAVFSHIHRIMERLIAAAGIKEAVEKTRSTYLQEKLEATLRSALVGADVRPGVKWKVGDQMFETDVLVVIDRTVIAAEAKASRLTPEGLRGAPARVKRHVEDMVLAPSLQSQRFADVMSDAQSGDAASIAILTGLGIDPEGVDRVIRLSVTLDDFAALSAAEGEFKKVGWVPADHELAPTVSIADLLCVVDILDKPLFLLHYLSERAHFQKALTLVGDELDFLGLYLENGFNFVLEDKNIVLTLSGSSESIDWYYEALEAGISLSKPAPKLSVLFTRIVNRLSERRPTGWTTVGVNLLGAASLPEQRQLEQSLDKLRAMVRKNYRDPGHPNTLHIEPPQKHKGRVGFYIFPEQLRGALRNTMEQLIGQMLDGRADSFVLFARSTEKWDVPYETVAYVKKRPTGGPRQGPV